MPPPAGIPYDVLVHFLQHVPLTERMSTCSLVQQAWREAAAAATTSIAITGMSAAAATAIVRQLAIDSTSWAQHITSISLGQHSDLVEALELVLPQLACPKLLQLHLSGFILTPTAHISIADSGGAADDRTAGSSGVNSGAADIGAAGRMGLVCDCPLLQELSLTSCWVELAEGRSSRSRVRNALSMLTSLTALTRLHMGADVYVTAGGDDGLWAPKLGPLSALTGLQELSLKEPKKRQVQGLFSRIQGKQLLPSLTKLSILTNPSSRPTYMKYSISATPGLYGLSSLRCLDLKGAYVDSVQQLSALSHLESLTLHRATTLRNQHPNFQPDSDSDSEGYDSYYDTYNEHSSVGDTGQLLQLLPQLPKLTHLDLFGLANTTAAVPQWTCIGRCTGLQVLRLQNLFMHKDSWPLLFAGAQLSKLRELRLIIYPPEESVPMPPRVVQQMVDACPSLEVLQLGGDGLLSTPGRNVMPEVQEALPVSLAPLTQLQHLTSLRVQSARTQAFSGLWRLRRLRQLVVSGRVTDLTLVQLSALTNLTSFRRLKHHEAEIETWDDSAQHLALSHSQAAPVWQQILDHCQQSAWCEAVFQHGQGLQAQVAAQQQQLEGQQRQLEAKEQQLAEQAAELAALKAYLAKQQLPV